MGYSVDDIFISLIGNEICGKKLPSDLELTGVDFPALYRLSDKHDLSHIVGVALNKFNAIKKEDIAYKKFFSKISLAVMRQENFDYSLNEISEIFDKNEIEYIPLKGAVIKNYYPEKYLRPSCDIDILVREDKKEKAVSVLEKAGYNKGEENYHDISLFNSSGVHIELHFNIKEDLENIDKLLSNVWDYSKKVEGYRYVLDGEFFIFSLVAHAYYHFVNGGCGVKTVLDFWILKNKFEFDENKVEEFCLDCKILDFYNGIKELSEVWFSDRDNSKLTDIMSEYVIDGGVYGTKSNFLLAEQSKTESKGNYIFARIFPKKAVLQKKYKKLEKWWILYPFYVVKRWFSVLFNKDKIKSELDVVKKTSSDDTDKMKFMMDKLGI